jgi:hypothetical protein
MRGFNIVMRLAPGKIAAWVLGSLEGLEARRMKKSQVSYLKPQLSGEALFWGGFNTSERRKLEKPMACRISRSAM